MSDEMVLRLVESSPENDALGLGNLMRLSHSQNAGIAESLDAAVSAGNVKKTVVEMSGRPLYLIYWHQNDLGGLNVNCALSLCEVDNFAVLVKGVEELARAVGTKFITFHTRRRGLVEKVKEFGYTIENVEMVKIL